MVTKPKAPGAKPATATLTPAQRAKFEADARLAEAKAAARVAASRAAEENMARSNKPGPGKGNPPSTAFKKGQPSANPKGRGKGVKNMLTEHKLRLMATTGMTPLEFLTAVYRDQLYTDYDIKAIDEKRGLVELLPKVKEDGTLVAKVEVKIEHRIAAATSAAPYVHRKMPIGIDGGEGKPLAVVTAEKLQNMTDEELDKMFAILSRLGIGLEAEGGSQKPYRLD